MAKAYWIACYRAIKNPDALADYAKLAGPAIQAGGGRFLARGNPAKTYEAGLAQRVVIIEFDSVQQATAAHDSPGYQAALKASAARPSATCASSKACENRRFHAMMAPSSGFHRRTPCRNTCS